VKHYTELRRAEWEDGAESARRNEMSQSGIFEGVLLLDKK